MDGFKEAELLSQLKQLSEENMILKTENLKLKLTMDDYGIESSDVEEIPDAEIIAMEQLNKLREISELATFTKEEADVYKILTKALMDIRGGSIKRQKKSPKGKDVDNEDLLDQLGKLRAIQGGKD